jgi:stage IV sporulation protein FB
VALTVCPVSAALAVLLAAALHEGGHLAALAAFRVPVEGVRLGWSGAVIRARGACRLSYGRELAVSLAGPAVNLLSAPPLAALSVRLGWDWGLLLAGAHTVLGVYNLLPIPPLDGSRTLYLLVACRFGPAAGERVRAAAGLTAALALTALGAYLTLRHGAALFLLGALGLLLPQLGLDKRRRTV